MSDTEILDGFRATDEYHGGKRQVIVSDGVLTVSYFRDSSEQYFEANEVKHYRLTEVEQRWVEVTS